MAFSRRERVRRKLFARAKVGRGGTDHGRRVILVLFLIILFLEVVFIKEQNNVSTRGIDYSVLEQRIHQQDAENQQLKEQLYTHESYQYIAEQAQKMGFVDAKQFVLH